MQKTYQSECLFPMASVEKPTPYFPSSLVLHSKSGFTNAVAPVYLGLWGLRYRESTKEWHLAQSNDVQGGWDWFELIHQGGREKTKCKGLEILIILDIASIQLFKRSNFMQRYLCLSC